jgi:hypothetical protein
MVFRQAASDRSQYLQSAFPNQPPRRPEKNISRILANTGQISVRFFDQSAITHRGGQSCAQSLSLRPETVPKTPSPRAQLERTGTSTQIPNSAPPNHLQLRREALVIKKLQT